MRLKELRKGKCLNQNELALKLNVSQETISVWENGDYEPPIAQLMKLADIFNVTVDYLIGRDRNDDKCSIYQNISIIRKN